MPSKTNESSKSQAARFLEAAKKAQLDQSGRKFSQAMGKITMARQARKTSKGQIGG